MWQSWDGYRVTEGSINTGHFLDGSSSQAGSGTTDNSRLSSFWLRSKEMLLENPRSSLEASSMKGAGNEKARSSLLSLKSNPPSGASTGFRPGLVLTSNVKDLAESGFANVIASFTPSPVAV